MSCSRTQHSDSVDGESQTSNPSISFQMSYQLSYCAPHKSYVHHVDSDKVGHQPSLIRPEVIKLFPCSTKLNTKLLAFLTFISMIITTSERLNARDFFNCQYFSFYEQLKFRAQLSRAWKKFYNLWAWALLCSLMAHGVSWFLHADSEGECSGWSESLLGAHIFFLGGGGGGVVIHWLSKVNVLKFEHFSHSVKKIKILIIKAGIHKMLVRILVANREDPDHTASCPKQAFLAGN